MCGYVVEFANYGKNRRKEVEIYVEWICECIRIVWDIHQIIWHF